MVKIYPVALEKKKLSHDDGRKLIAIGHLNEIRYIKNTYVVMVKVNCTKIEDFLKPRLGLTKCGSVVK